MTCSRALAAAHEGDRKTWPLHSTVPSCWISARSSLPRYVLVSARGGLMRPAAINSASPTSVRGGGGVWRRRRRPPTAGRTRRHFQPNTETLQRGANLPAREAVDPSSQRGDEPVRRVPGEELFNRLADGTVGAVGLPETQEDIPSIRDVLAGEIAKGVRCYLAILADPEPAKQLLLHVYGGVCVVEPPLVPISERNPTDARDGGVAHDLPGPPPIRQVLAIALGLYE